MRCVDPDHGHRIAVGITCDAVHSNNEQRRYCVVWKSLITAALRIR